MQVTKTVQPLRDLVSFEGFRFLRYQLHEQTLLKPQLEAQGFTGVCFGMGEADDYGPLCRIASCRDQDGNKRMFYYG
jgi:hypothetical protein